MSNNEAREARAVMMFNIMRQRKWWRGDDKQPPIR